MKRWTCPTCGGGKLAPSRMSADDVRRYCLGCSEKTGKLVRRECAALERKRETSAQRRKAAMLKSADRKRAAEKAKWTVGETDMRAELIRLAGLPAVALHSRRYGRDGRKTVVPDFTMTRRTDGYSTGVAYPAEGRMHVSAAGRAGCSLKNEATTHATLVHELAHMVAPSRDWHSEKWRRIFVLIASEAWGFDPRAADAKRGTSHELHDRVETLIHEALQQARERRAA